MKISAAIVLAVAGLGITSNGAQLSLTVHTDQTTKTISTGIYGQFLEHIFNSVHGGLWGDRILNGTLEVVSAGHGRRGAAAIAAIDNRTVKSTMPPLSAGIVKLTR